MSEATTRQLAGRHLGQGEFYGDVLDKRRGDGFILSELRHGERRRLPAHTHELAYFCLLLGGAYREQVGRRVYEYEPFTVMFHPPGLRHRDEVGASGGRFFNVEIQGGWLERLRECGASVPGPVRDARGGELVWLAARLYREYRDNDAPTRLDAEGLVLEMLARAALPEGTEERRPPAWLGTAVELLRAEFRESLTVADVAARVGVHPFHLSKVFRRFRRQSVGDYVQRLRVRHAAGLLAAGGMSLAEVALASGFSDQSHFTRVCHRVTGATPGALRGALNGGRSPRPASLEDV
jgi:AraC family transcriptional regulator